MSAGSGTSIIIPSGGLAQAIARARATGMSWQTIGQTLGATDDAETKNQLIDALAANRRAVMTHLLHELS